MQFIRIHALLIGVLFGVAWPRLGLVWNSLTADADWALWVVAWLEMAAREFAPATTLLAVLLGIELWRRGIRPGAALQRSIPLLILLIFASFGFLLGVSRAQPYAQSVALVDTFIGQRVQLQGEIVDDPSYHKSGQREFHIDAVRLSVGGEFDSDGGSGSDLENLQILGQIRIRAFTGPLLLTRGDVVTARGKLRPALGNRVGQISFAQIESHTLSNDSFESARVSFFAGAYTALPEPHASLGLGFIVGLRALLPDGLLDALSITGLTHIVAVSGYNLTVLVRITRRLFSKRSLFIAMAASFGLIAGFIAVTGFAPSIVRAGIVAVLSLFAWYYGRTISPILLLLLGAGITAMINPYFMWFDLGWYLSFFAFFGVLLLSPSVLARLYGERQPPMIPQLIIETSCAQLATTPLILVVFNEISVIAILANAFVLPGIPIAMFFSAIASVAGMIHPILAGWLAWPARIVLETLLSMIGIFAEVPWAKITIPISWFDFALLMGIFVISTLMLYRRTPLAQNYSIIE